MHKTKHNILVVASPWLGGSGSVGCELSEELAKRGHNVSFVSYDWPFKVDGRMDNWEYHSVKPYQYPLFPFPLYELALAEEMVEVALKNRVTIIHAHYGILFGHAALMAQATLKSRGVNVKVVITFHGSDGLGFDFESPGSVVPRYLNNWIIDQADAVTVGSENLKNWLQKIYSVRNKIQVIPNFIDLTKWKPKKHPYNHCTIVHISNFRKVKRPVEVMKIFELVSERVNSRLIMIGDGPELQSIHDYVQSKRLQQHVQFLGKQSPEQIIPILQSSHVLLLPSLYENSPLSVIEAQACGIPVVASRVGGIGEFVEDGKTGFLVDPKQVENYSEPMLKLLTNNRLWGTMSRAASLSMKSFSVENVISQYENMYKRL